MFYIKCDIYKQGDDVHVSTMFAPLHEHINRLPSLVLSGGDGLVAGRSIQVFISDL
jgi:hypothetical protein